MHELFITIISAVKLIAYPSISKKYFHCLRKHLLINNHAHLIALVQHPLMIKIKKFIKTQTTRQKNNCKTERFSIGRHQREKE